MDDLSIKVDETGLKEVKFFLSGIKNGYPKVAARVINKTMAGAVTDSKREIGKDLNLTAGRIAKDFKIFRANPGNLNAWIRSTGKPVNLTSFKGTRQTKKGLPVKVKTKGQRRILKHGFLMKGKTKSGEGYQTAFWRQYDGPRKPQNAFVRRPWKLGKKKGGAGFMEKYRSPVHALSGPRIQDSLSNPVRIETIQKKASVRLEKAANYELDRFLKAI